jgi:hypothetical protein
MLTRFDFSALCEKINYTVVAVQGEPNGMTFGEVEATKADGMPRLHLHSGEFQ